MFMPSMARGALGKKPSMHEARGQVSLDSAQDFYELTQLKMANPNFVKAEKRDWCARMCGE